MLSKPYDNLEINTGFVLERMHDLKTSGKTFSDLAKKIVKPSGEIGITTAWMSSIIHNNVTFATDYIRQIAVYLDVQESDMLRVAKAVKAGEPKLNK